MPVYPLGGGSGSSNPGGIGPEGGAGGTRAPIPGLPVPGIDMFQEFEVGLGDVDLDGTYGGQVINEETSGDLGTAYLDLNRYLLLAESKRENSDFNDVSHVNHRYRGHRESNKFNLIMQKVVTVCARLFLSLRSANQVLKVREMDDMYPTDTEIAELYHTRIQIVFKEWQLLKDDDKRWFS
jgi:hypothetical protein